MRILILSADYASYLTWLYRGTPNLEHASYAEQLNARVSSLFGIADFYPRNFTALGHDASQIFVHNIWMQTAWAQERGMNVPLAPSPGEIGQDTDFVMHLKRRLRPYRDALTPLAKKMGLVKAMSSTGRDILLAQIEAFDPDVILNQDIEFVDSDFLRRIRRANRIIIAQHCGQFPDSFDPSPYTFGISLVPSIVETLRNKGLRTEYCHLAFDPSVLERLPPPPPKDIDVSFVGGLSSGHTQRIEMLEAVARAVPVNLYLSNFKGIPKNSPLHAHARPEVWGRDMYDVLRRSKITLNSHIDAAGGSAANMRLYEATGVGSFLLTDNLRNLSSLFQPGIHVGVYDSPSDCVAKIKYYLTHETAREEIAKAGQQHTLQHHTYRHRTQQILELIDKYR